MITKSALRKKSRKSWRSIFGYNPKPFFSGFQTKLIQGKPGDKYEQEADFMASKVLENTHSGGDGFLNYSGSTFFKGRNHAVQEKPLAEAITPLFQHQEEEEELQVRQMADVSLQTEEKEEPVQMQSIEEEDEIQAKYPEGFEGPEDEITIAGQVEEEEDKIQAKPNGDTTVSPVVENSLKNSASQGSKLDPETLAQMEQGFGADFSDVNIHTDEKAVQMSNELGAHAFTHGKDIYFNKGKYNPNTDEGKHLLAHELTHTIQQKGMVPLNLQYRIGDGHDLTAPRFAGNEILEACYDGERVLQSGSSGTAVSLIQQALVDAGFALPRYGVDGFFGNETRQALMDFQRASSIVADGVVGPATMSALNALFSPGASPVPVVPQPAASPVVTSQTVKPAPDGTANSRTTVGVGEIVRLTSSTAGTWTVSQGRIIGLNTGSVILWEAPATASSATITITSPGGTSVLTFTVIAPNALTMTIFSHDAIPSGTAGACMIMDVVVNPRNVNFGRTQWLEVPGPASNVSGYFNRFQAATIFHNPNPNYLPFNDNNTGLQDHAAWHGVPAPFSFGTFDWVIPNRYKIDGEPDGSGRFFTNTVQAFTMFSSGTMMINKAGSTVMRFINNTIIP